MTQKQFADGVLYTQKLYVDNGNKPHRAFILQLDPKKVTLHYGTSQDSYTLIPEIRQNIQEHMQASVANGYDVLAAVNGDFFAISSDYHPFGVTVKNGQLLGAERSDLPYTAVTKDNKFIIVTESEEQLDTSNLQNAFGARNILLKDGEFLITKVSSVMGDEQHPRTIAGITQDGQLLLVVIDGRQPNWSNVN